MDYGLLSITEEVLTLDNSHYSSIRQRTRVTTGLLGIDCWPYKVILAPWTRDISSMLITSLTILLLDVAH